MNDSTAIKVTGCNREDCPVNQGGICIEDVEHIEECENAIIVEAKPKEEFQTVRTGQGLSLEDVATMLQDRKIPTASVIGAGKSGKTTFLAMLFHRFLRTHEGFNNQFFMDSETFLGLNQKLHYADIKSKNYTVQMPRTSLDEEPVFHFKTKNKDGSEHECLWIDIPGEALEHRLSKGIAGWKEYRSLARSTHIVLFLDLEIVSDPSKRGAHVEQALDALAYSIQSKTWNDRKLMVVFSKADVYVDDLKEQVIAIKSRILARLNDDFKDIEFCELHSLGAEPESGASLAKVWSWVQ